MPRQWLPIEIRREHDGLLCAPHLMSEPERERVYGDTPDWFRASGECVCETCGEQYYDHPMVIGALWLTRLCDDTFVKL